MEFWVGYKGEAYLHHIYCKVTNQIQGENQVIQSEKDVHIYICVCIYILTFKKPLCVCVQAHLSIEVYKHTKNNIYQSDNHEKI
jgi:hypothetical protein